MQRTNTIGRHLAINIPFNPDQHANRSIALELSNTYLNRDYALLVDHHFLSHTFLTFCRCPSETTVIWLNMIICYEIILILIHMMSYPHEIREVALHSFHWGSGRIKASPVILSPRSSHPLIALRVTPRPKSSGRGETLYSRHLARKGKRERG